MYIIKIITLYLFFLFISADIIAQGTIYKGQLLKFNFASETLDTTSIGNWFEGDWYNSYGYYYSSHECYYSVINTKQRTFLLKISSSSGFTSTGFSLILEEPELDNAETYYHFDGEADVITPFTLFDSIPLLVDDGIELFNGDFGFKYVSLSDGEFLIHQPNFDNLLLPCICGKTNNSYLMPVYYDIYDDIEFFLAYTDDSLKLSMGEKIYLSDPSSDAYYSLSFLRNLSNNIYISSRADGGNPTIYKLESDTLKTISILDDFKYYIYKSKLCTWNNFNIMMTEIDTSSGQIINRDTLITDVLPHNFGFPVSGDNICYLRDDSLHVYNLQTRNNIFALSLEPYWISDKTPFIDSNSVYLHSLYLIADNENDNAVPASYNLCQNYPNPFNASTTITYYLPEQNDVVITIFDLLGKEVTSFIEKGKSAGEHKITFQADNLTSGVYFYRMNAGVFSQTKKFILLK